MQKFIKHIVTDLNADNNTAALADETNVHKEVKTENFEGEIIISFIKTTEKSI